MKYQQKWRFEYEKNGEKKVCYPRSKEQIEKNREVCKNNGYKVLGVKKLYIFNTYRNQHNFMLIANICFNKIHDMEIGEIPWNDAEFDNLAKTKEKADQFFSLPLPVAYLTWEEWQEANEMAQNAIFHRQEACIANGRPDLVTYC